MSATIDDAEKQAPVDGMVATRERLIFGWLVDLQDPARKRAVEIFVDKQRVGFACADRYLEAVQAKHGGDGFYGFAFYYDGQIERDAVEVAAIESESGSPVRCKRPPLLTQSKRSGPPLSIRRLRIAEKVEILGRVGAYPGKNLALEVWRSGERLSTEIPLCFAGKNRAFTAEIPPELLPPILRGDAEIALRGLKEADLAVQMREIVFATAACRNGMIRIGLSGNLELGERVPLTVRFTGSEAASVDVPISISSNSATVAAPPQFHFSNGSVQVLIGDAAVPMRLHDGHIDLLTHRKVKGWAAEVSDGKYRHPNLSVIVDGQTVGRLTPSIYRDHLARGGIGDGTFGFNFAFPKLIRHDSVVELISDSGMKLETNPNTRLDFEPELIGHLDVLNHHEMKGWACEIRDGEYRHPHLSVIVDRRTVGRITPSLRRGYLERKGIADGTFGFTFRFPALIRKDSVVELISDSGARLNTSGKTMMGFAPDYATLIVHVSDFDQRAILEATKVALYVTFSSCGKFHRFQHAQVSELQSAGYFVVGIHAAADASADWLSSRLCDVDIFKKNIGYDFGSWCVGIQWLDQFAGEYQHRLHALVLMNDSCFGIVSRAKLEELSRRPENIIGVSDSYQRTHHLQSYFTLCQGETLANGEFCELVRDYIFPSTKEEAINFGELRLSQRLEDGGATIAATCDYFDLAARWLQNMPEKMEREKAIYRSLGFSSGSADEAVEAPFVRVMTMLRRRTPVNPSHVFWEEILQSGVALVKRGLLLDNPADVPDYFSLCRTCLEADIVSLEELQLYLADEAKPPLVSSFLRLLSAGAETSSVADRIGRRVALTRGHSRPS